MSASHLFSEADRKRIEEAVQEAESRTSGEIVPVIVASSGSYPSALWKAALLGVIPGLLVREWLVLGPSNWGMSAWSVQITPLTMIVGALLFAAAARSIPELQRMLVPSSRMIESVHARAQQAFLENEVFRTRERTGILILVSLFEHRVEVLGDSMINEKLDSNDWADVVTDIIGGIKSGEPTSGLVSAIERCGRLLEKAGVARRVDDQDELPNAPQIH
jgi:putative membrane protein